MNCWCWMKRLACPNRPKPFSRCARNCTRFPKVPRVPLMLRLLISFLMLLGSARAEELRIAILGNFPENKGLETLAAQYAVDAANANETRRHGKVKLVVYNDHG